jgi:hypothetical protein
VRFAPKTADRDCLRDESLRELSRALCRDVRGAAYEGRRVRKETRAAHVRGGSGAWNAARKCRKVARVSKKTRVLAAEPASGPALVSRLGYGVFGTQECEFTSRLVCGSHDTQVGDDLKVPSFEM